MWYQNGPKIKSLKFSSLYCENNFSLKTSDIIEVLSGAFKSDVWAALGISFVAILIYLLIVRFRESQLFGKSKATINE